PSAAIKYQENEGTIDNNPFTGKRYDLEFKQPISLGGKDMYVLKQTKKELNIANENLKKVSLDLTFEIAQNYYNLIYSENEFKTLLELKAEAFQLLNLAQSKYKLGVISELDYFNAKHLYEQIEFKTLSSRSNLSLVKLGLCQKLDVDEKIRFDFPLTLSVPSDIFVLEDCVSTAMEKRAEMRIAGDYLLYSEYGKKAAKANSFPRVDLVGKIGQGKETYEFENRDLKTEWLLGAKVEVPFGANTASASYSMDKKAQSLSSYHSGDESQSREYKIDILNNLGIHTEKKQSEIDHKKAMNDLDEAKKKIIQEVKESFYAYQKSSIQRKSSKSKVVFLEKDESFTEAKTKNNKAKIAELLQVKINRVQARLEYLKSLTEVNINICALYKARGEERP
ncbi:MAG: TolC family protein, partial [Candidatus Omnitrophota bacterium]